MCFGEFRPWVGAEFVGQRAASVLERREGVGRAPDGVQRAHELCPRTFPQRMLGDEFVQLGQDFFGAPQSQPRFDVVACRVRAKFVQAYGLSGRLVEIGESRTAPESERFGQDVGRLRVLPGCQ